MKSNIKFFDEDDLGKQENVKLLKGLYPFIKSQLKKQFGLTIQVFRNPFIYV